MNRTTWVIGNWKQNFLCDQAAGCAAAIAQELPPAGLPVRAGVAPPYPALQAVQPHARPKGPLWLFAQDVAAQESGAFTGEVGPAMVRDAGANGAIVGHSERRAMFGDSNDLVAGKLGCALAGGLTVVLCVGEQLASRDAGTHEATVISQLCAAFAEVTPEQCDDRLILAYEPVWAIGTGRTATPEQAAAMHTTIRGWLRERFSAAGAGRSILYGGSVKPDNAARLLRAGEVDGFLVGGASLDPATFLAIVRAAANHVSPS